MAVRRIAVQQPGERAVGDHAGHVAQLDEPVQPQLTHPHEIGFAECGPHDDLGQQLEAALGETTESGHAEERRVRADVDVELRADSRELLVHLDGRPRPRPFVEHVGRQCGETFLPLRIVGGAATDDQQEPDQRHRFVANAPHPKPLASDDLSMAGKAKRGTGRRAGQSRAIDADRGARCVHDTSTGVESGIARSMRPRGTMLIVMRRSESR